MVKREVMKLTNNKRMTVMLTPDLEDKVYELRRKDQYCRMTISEIIRILIQKGLEAEAQPA